MSELKLLNCPFCGGEARLYGNSKLIGTRLKHYQVAVCTNDDCGCRTSPCETVEDAIYKWNRRKPMANIVEKLEEKQCQANKDMQISELHEDVQAYGGKYLAFSEAINIVKQEINNGLE